MGKEFEKVVLTLGYTDENEFVLNFVLPIFGTALFFALFVFLFLKSLPSYYSVIIIALAFFFIVGYPLTLYNKKKTNINEKLHFMITYAGMVSSLDLPRRKVFEAIADKNKNPGLVADILRRKANCYFFMSDYETALEYNNKALTIRDSDIFSQDDSVNIAEKANIYYNIAIINQFLENYFEAIKFALKLEPLYRKIADDSKLGYRCYNLTAKLYYQIGDIANAQLYALKELEIMESINDNISLSYTLDFLAMLKQSQNQLDECLDLQYKSLKIRNSIGDSVLISYSYNNIGSSLLIKEDLRRALDYFYKSLKIKLKYDDIYNIAPTYNNLGYTYQKMNDICHIEKRKRC